MRIWTRVLVVGAVAVSSAVAGVTVANAGDPEPGSIGADQSPPATRSVRDLGSGTTESRYIPKVPCRIVDTRNGGGGPVGNNQTRTFVVKGSGAGFVTQGGNPGGCGIPTNATAIEAAVTAVDSNSGYMRIYPSNFTEPNATFINYSPYDPTNTGAISLCNSSCPAGGEISVRGHGGSTQVVIDVQGYYVKPMAGEVSAAGALLKSSRIVSSDKNATGSYTVTFDRNVTGCTYFAQSRYAPQVVSAAQPGENSNEVDVYVKNLDNAFTDSNFYIEVTC